MTQRYFVQQGESWLGPFRPGELAALRHQGYLAGSPMVRGEEDGQVVPLAGDFASPLTRAGSTRSLDQDPLEPSTAGGSLSGFDFGMLPREDVGLTPPRAVFWLLAALSGAVIVLCLLSSLPFSWVYPGAGAGAACVMLYRALTEHTRVRQALADTPTSKVRSVSLGQAELCGKVVPIELGMGSVQSARSSWRFTALLEAGVSGDKTVESSPLAMPFYLDDGTGRIMVVTQGAEVITNVADVSHKSSYWDYAGALLPGTWVTVVGCVQPLVESQPEFGLMVAPGEPGQPFAIVIGTEPGARKRFWGRLIFLTGSALIMLLASLAYVLMMRR